MSKKIKLFDIPENPSQSLYRKPESKLFWLITVSWNENIKLLGTLKLPSRPPSIHFILTWEKSCEKYEFLRRS